MNMDSETSSPSPTPPDSGPMADHLSSPFPSIPGLDRHNFRQVAYEIFFTACRSLPGFGGRHAIPYYKSGGAGDAAGGPDPPAAAPSVNSKLKGELGLKMLNRIRRGNSSGSSNPSSPTRSLHPGVSPNVKLGFTVPQRGRSRRPMTSAEIMKQQMRISDQSDNRLRKTLMRTLVGQMGRRAETIILPLELLRHLKPTEFSSDHGYHVWQKSQLKILEAGLILYPAIPLEKSNTAAATLEKIIESSEMEPIDTGRTSETMRALSNCIIALAWRDDSAEVCHWADGYPLNVHIYNALLCSLFDLTDETFILDEVDELMELVKKTWTVLGVNRSVHNVCFMWVLFEQYVATGQVEPNLHSASLVMLKQVATDAKTAVREPLFLKVLPCALAAIAKWCGKKFKDYHKNFSEEIGTMENMLPMLFSSTKILEENIPKQASSPHHKEQDDIEIDGYSFDHYIRSSMKNAFTKMVQEETNNGIGNIDAQELSKQLLKLAKRTEDLASKENEIFSPILKKWYPAATGVASMALHTCYGSLLKQYLNAKSVAFNETLLLLERAGKLEQTLIQTVVENSVECEDGGKSMIRQMVPYEVDSWTSNFLKEWIQERLQKGKELHLRSKQTESWNPKSKTQPYAQSAKELLGFAKETMEKFNQIPINVVEDVFLDLIDGLDNLFSDYITFVASCGAKQSYLPTLPPLTRCCHDSKLFKLLKKTTCGVGLDDSFRNLFSDGKNPNFSTSRGTQRLWIRLNTMSYLQSQLQSLEKTLSKCSKVIPSKNQLAIRKQPDSPYFEQSYPAFQVASQHVSEVAAYRLVFLDSYSVFYGSLYIGSVAKTRIHLALRVLEQNLTLLCTIVALQVQPIALKEVMRASFEGFLRILLAGGNSRIFSQLDHPMIKEDLDSLKYVFYQCGEGMLTKEIVDKEADAANGVVELMGQSSEQVVETFKSLAYENCGPGIAGSKPRIPMPPTTGKWSKTDLNTILRVLCNRNERVANRFLKKTFRLPKRRLGNRMN